MIRKTIAVPALLLGSALLISGCDIEGDSPVTQEQQSEQAQEDETVDPDDDELDTTEYPGQDSPEPDEVGIDDVSGEDTDVPPPSDAPFTGDLTYQESQMVLELTVAQMSDSDFEDACVAYELMGQDASYDAFSEGFGDESTLDKEAFIDFFDQEC